MRSKEFEEKFDAFLEGRRYDIAQEALFQVVRSAFIAGWEAAGGAPPEYRFKEVDPSLYICKLREP